MLKRFVLNARRPAATPEEFTHHWRNVHGPLMADMPEYREYVLRYVQNHIHADLGPQSFAFDGITEVWPNAFASGAFSDTAAYRSRVKPDEALLVDPTRTIVFRANESTLRARRAGTKLVLLSNWGGAQDPSHDTVRAGALLRGFETSAALRNELSGLVYNRIKPGSARTFAAPDAVPFYDSVFELWLRDEAAIPALRSALGSPSVPIRRDTYCLLAVRELTVFDQMGRS